MNTGLFILVVLLVVSWWVSGEVHRLQDNKQEQLDNELALARIVGVLDE
jgi:Na+-transporting NADH:ubiquinone oxidoreductase subunit NqrC